MKGKLILEDGSVYTGELLDSETRAVGEVVFTTTMTGYQESLTDPSFCGQILTMTYPLIGNYGTAEKFMQSRRSFVRGFVIGELCEQLAGRGKSDGLSAGKQYSVPLPRRYKGCDTSYPLCRCNEGRDCSREHGRVRDCSAAR